MKTLTENLIRFGIVFLIGAIVFRGGLSYLIENKLFSLLWVLAIIYFFYNLGIGWYFGKKDYESLPLYDIGFRYHFATYVIFNLVSELWYLFGFQSQYEDIRIVHLIALCWGAGILIHFVFYLINRKNTIKGINKSEIFE